MWPSYVINLARNTQRMDNSARQLDAAGLPWERIEAVNGWDLPEAEVARVYDASRNASDGKQPLVPPEIGCYLSHIAAWERIAEGPDPGGFIFEDDFAADDTLGEKLALLSQPQDDWDMVKLFSFDADAPLEWDKPLGHYRIGMPYRVPTCLIGYGLTREAAAHLGRPRAALLSPRGRGPEIRLGNRPARSTDPAAADPCGRPEHGDRHHRQRTPRRTGRPGRACPRPPQPALQPALFVEPRPPPPQGTPQLSGGRIMTATRVLHMHFGKDGGAERFFVSLAQALAERGCRAALRCAPEPQLAG
jgi:GR25 family glycosyltransferase involved in LPS biosynthesis